MLISGLFHVAIRTADLDKTVSFYTQVLGLKEVPRPENLSFPGAWLAAPDAMGQVIVHVYAGSAHGPAAITDHVPLLKMPQQAFTSSSSNASVPSSGDASSAADRTMPASARVSTNTMAGVGCRSRG